MDVHEKDAALPEIDGILPGVFGNLAQVKCDSFPPRSTHDARAPSGSTGASGLIFIAGHIGRLCHELMP